MTKKKTVFITLGGASLLVSAILAASQNFVPDVTFSGSSLAGWHQLGQADWGAENGEIVGTPKQESGGWLVLDKGYQDVAFYAAFRYAGISKAGVLLRPKDRDRDERCVRLAHRAGHTVVRDRAR